MATLLAFIRVLWRHPYNGALYGISYEMRPGQSPTDIWRGPAKRVQAWSPALGTHDAWVGEVIPHDWITLDEQREAIKAWLAALELRDPGVVPTNPYEWSMIELVADRKCHRTACTNLVGEQPGVHRDTKDLYCLPCARRINEANKENLILWKPTGPSST